jgi:hypothetical protein
MENMGLKHKVTINVARPGGENNPVIQSSERSIRSRFLNWLLGKKIDLLVVTPGETVETVEIKEIKERGEGHE